MNFFSLSRWSGVCIGILHAETSSSMSQGLQCRSPSASTMILEAKEKPGLLFLFGRNNSKRWMRQLDESTAVTALVGFAIPRHAIH